MRIWYNLHPSTLTGKMNRQTHTTSTSSSCAQRGLKVSAKTRYGLRILLDVAAHNRDAKPRSIAEIAKSQRISEKFISRLVIPLREAGLLRSVRGSGGGFRLARSTEDITLLKVVETMQGPLAILDCLSDADDGCPRKPNCLARQIWSDVNTGFMNVLARVTLARILDRSPDEAAAMDFCI